MSLSILDITTGISWTADRTIYLLNFKDDKYELLVDYLNRRTPEDIVDEINRLERFKSIQETGDKAIIDAFIMSELEGFTEYDDGWFAHIAGAHDFSPSVHYDIRDDSISLHHPNLPSLKRFIVTPDTLISLLAQMKKLIESLVS